VRVRDDVGIVPYIRDGVHLTQCACLKLYKGRNV